MFRSRKGRRLPMKAERRPTEIQVGFLLGTVRSLKESVDIVSRRLVDLGRGNFERWLLNKCELIQEGV